MYDYISVIKHDEFKHNSVFTFAAVGSVRLLTLTAYSK
jgi:hypothetical protein